MKNFLFRQLVKSDNKKISVIVEMSGNHQRSLNGAKKFINAAIKYGADIIKFQVYTPDTITLNAKNKDFLVQSDNKWNKHKNLYSLYRKAYTPWVWIEQLIKILNKKNIAWFASPFDITAVNFLEKLKCPAYKIASPEITDLNLIEKIASTNKPILLSTGVAIIEDIDLAIKTIKKKHDKFAILKCVSAYPTPINELNLKGINLLKKRYKCAVGYSDHTIGDLASKVAVSLGATIIEKHFKVDGDKKSIDQHFSMSLSKLKNFKKDLDNIQTSLGEENLDILKSAKRSMRARRSLYICKDIKKGEKFTSDNIKSVRPAFGLHPKFLKKILGRKANRDLKSGLRLSMSLIKKDFI
jgi:N-acetylneuraminate synthase/pseudaminic acid synthase